ncbi:MAG: methylenetetrahydrofolate reductase [NAD(P)H] [Alkalispirochaetaceae bacterium]
MNKTNSGNSETPLVAEMLRAGKTRFSFEFFPPKSEKGWERLFHSISELLPLKPAYVSVTYGAGGTTRENTHELVTRLQRETGLTVVAHLTCVGATEEEIRRVLARYRADGVRNILALRGDPPRDPEVREQLEGKLGPDGSGSPDFPYASELVSFIRSEFPEMGIGVAGFVEGHPATPNRLEELRYLKEKVDAGADYIVTQLFFDNRDYYDFVDRARLAGITVPIIAGIMPVTSPKGMEKMAELAAGARFPAKLQRSLRRAETREQFERVGIHWATEQVADLLNHDVPGVHLYTLNNSTATIQICQNLGLSSYAI